jgi:hypothetical protein
MSKHKEDLFITSSQAASWDEGFAPEFFDRGDEKALVFLPWTVEAA